MLGGAHEVQVRSAQPLRFRVGGYHVLKKWLQPKHRSPDDSQFRSIAAAIDQTVAIMADIDTTTAKHGGFPAAFASGGRESLAGQMNP